MRAVREQGSHTLYMVVKTFSNVNYHLNNINQCYNAIADLQLTISEDYFISDNIDRSISYNCLGVAFQLIGNHEMAELSFLQTVELDTIGNRAS